MNANTNGIKTIAYYLPQYHPIPENDEWWGKGFTEWTNVAKAKPLFKGHVQPFLPGDLGFYDLRVPEVREAQAQLAKDAGLYGFCYWHYWFGGGKQLLERPINEVISSGKPDFPFCLAWANESWSGRWHGLHDKVLATQEYLGEHDFEQFFNSCLPAFQDKRYIREGGKLLFSIYQPFGSPLIPEFIKQWHNLAEKNSLGGFHFNAINARANALKLGFDSYTSGTPRSKQANNFFNRLSLKHFNIRISDLIRNFPHQGPAIYNYKDVVAEHLNKPIPDKEIPVILTNWDNTPRSGRAGIVCESASSEQFELYLKKAFAAVSANPNTSQIVFIKSWNEWAEGNVMEPSRLHGNSYLQALKSVTQQHKNNN
ncbi:MAG TPA: glycoside hydrolase family 99-like domain-containing protein [Bacteroidia bacterium]|nr:glycoside hydrolase family 99-like domain-containing protein [Bacteroidia bacterium]